MGTILGYIELVEVNLIIMYLRAATLLQLATITPAGRPRTPTRWTRRPSLPGVSGTILGLYKACRTPIFGA